MNAIYQPKGKAAEYAEWACNFYVGCSNNCSYCFLKKGRGAKILGGCTPTLKKCFKNKEHALEIFQKEVKANLAQLQEKGIFFSFTTDVMLPETIRLTQLACKICIVNDIPITILTKRADWQIEELLREIKANNTIWNYEAKKYLFRFGFTLTGHNELESNASTNQERIEAIKKLHDAGFKTWVSLEPIIDFASSLDMFNQTIDYCDHYKIGLLKGAKYPIAELKEFVNSICEKANNTNATVYFKDSITSKLNNDMYFGLNMDKNVVPQNFKF